MQGMCYLLIKFGQAEYIENLYHKGEIYINTADYYSGSSDSEIGDEYEGKEAVMKVTKITITPEESDSSFECFPINNNLFLENKVKTNIYSLFGISNKNLVMDGNYQMKIDFREFKSELWTSALYIYNVNEFKDRVISALKNEGYSCSFEPCSYNISDDKSHYNIPPNSKREKYKHQNEFRFIVENPQNRPIKIYIGALYDIAQMIPKNSLNKLNCEMCISFSVQD